MTAATPHPLIYIDVFCQFDDYNAEIPLPAQGHASPITALSSSAQINDAHYNALLPLE